MGGMDDGAWTNGLATLRGDGALIANDPAALDAEIGAARGQIERGVADLVDGSLRLAQALVRMRASGGYRSLGYPSFERYCRERHGITAETARFYMLPLETLGADAYRALLHDYGRRRAYYLAQVYRLDPTMFAVLTNAGDASAPAATALERLVADMRRQAQEALERASGLEAALAREQMLGRTLSNRLAQLEALNRELQRERDSALLDRPVTRDADARSGRERDSAPPDRPVTRDADARSGRDGAHPPAAGDGGVWGAVVRALTQHPTPEATAAIWTAAAVLLERGVWPRPPGAPPLATMAAALRRLAHEVMQSGRDGADRRPVRDEA
jgi:hypothetical protein